jgi:hypothetical protein
MEKVFEANVNITEYSSHVVQLFSYIFFLNKGKFLDVNASMIQHINSFVHEFTKANYSQKKCTYISDLYCGKVFKTHCFLDFFIFQKSKQNILWKADLFVLRQLLNR